MAATNTISLKHIPGNRVEVIASVLLDASYPTGGYAWDANAVLGLSKIDALQIAPQGGVVPEYDSVNKKILCRGGAAAGGLLAEITAATNLSAITLKVVGEGSKSV